MQGDNIMQWKPELKPLNEAERLTLAGIIGLHGYAFVLAAIADDMHTNADKHSYVDTKKCAFIVDQCVEALALVLEKTEAIKK